MTLGVIKVRKVQGQLRSAEIYMCKYWDKYVQRVYRMCVHSVMYIFVG